MFDHLAVELKSSLQQNLSEGEFNWLFEAIEAIKKSGTARKLYLTYSLCCTKIDESSTIKLKGFSTGFKDFLILQKTNNRQLARVGLLHSVLSHDSKFIEPVKKLIEIADSTELESFLKYLVLLPNAENYKFAAVEALRTNIATVFDAISKYNPYPAAYFNNQQWNQMYLKAAFMQQDLNAIANIDERANADLARIISDYAHERWAASRTIDPLFWRPVSNFLEGNLVSDIQRLFSSENPRENKAAALVCFNSKLMVAENLLKENPKLREEIKKGSLSWQTL